MTRSFWLIAVCAWLVSAGSAAAQTFFGTLATEAAVGVERGQISLLSEVETATRYVTFDSYGSEAIGRNVAALAFALPDRVTRGDQVDLVLLGAGLGEGDAPELAAAGATWRVPVTNGAMLYTTASHARVRLDPDWPAFPGIKGHRRTATAGFRYERALSQDARLTLTGELKFRDAEAEAGATTVLDEQLRVLLATLRYETGRPFALRRRATVAVAAGLDAFGASAAANSRASAPGADPAFFRVSGAAETSVPLSAAFAVNAGVFGQWTEDVLPVSQKCGFGTNAYARGFDRSTVLGDRCLGGRVEIAASRRVSGVLTQPFLGLDGGWLDLAAGDEQWRADGWSSLSGGVRALGKDWVGEIALTHALDAPDTARDQDDTRVWFRAGLRF